MSEEYRYLKTMPHFVRDGVPLLTGFTRDRIEMLKKTQWKILTEMSKSVRPGGRLVYSTCSLEQEENEELVGRWVREHKDWRLVKAKRLFPPKSGTDGAYAALLVRGK